MEPVAPTCQDFGSSRMPTFLMLTVYCLLASQPDVAMSRVNGGQSGHAKSCWRTSPARALRALNITVSHRSSLPVSIKRHLYGFGPDCVNRNLSYWDKRIPSRSSSCPWIPRTHRDSSRIPHTISYVQCRCKSCAHQYVHGGLCTEVMWEFSVLKKECTDEGTIEMKRVFQSFPVACVCVPRLFAHRD